MRRAIATFFALLPLLSHAQRSYTALQIQRTADSVLHATAGERVFRGAQCRTKPFYVSRVDGEEAYEYVPDTGKTAGNFLGASVRYWFDIPWPECTAFSRATGATDVHLDSLLHPIGLPSLDSLPDFVLNNEPCGLMTKAEAIAIAAQRNLYVVGMTAVLRFHRNPKRFVWYLQEPQTGPVDTSFIAEARAGKPFRLPFKTLRIDARTGEEVIDKLKLDGPVRW